MGCPLLIRSTIWLKDVGKGAGGGDGIGVAAAPVWLNMLELMDSLMPEFSAEGLRMMVDS